MGGLRKKMPITFWTFLIGGFALSGFPFITAGFWSKDEILGDAFAHGHTAVFWTLAIAALLTAFYTMRQITLTFLGEPRTKEAEHAQETPWTMTLPLAVLAFFALAIGWLGIPEDFPLIGGLIPNLVHGVSDTLLYAEVQLETLTFNPIPLTASLIVALGGLLLGWLLYRNFKVGQTDPLKKTLAGFHTVLQNKYYFDEFYGATFVRFSDWISETFTFKWMDRGVIDGILHSVARVAFALGGIFKQRFEMPVISGGADAIGEGVKSLGRNFRVIQSGRIQQYMNLVLIIVVLFGALFYFLLQ